MRIGIHMGYSSADQVAAECRDCGVDEIFLSASTVPGFDERGHATAGEFTRVVEELGARDVLVSGVILSPPSQEAVLGTAPEERKALCETIRAAGRAGIDTSLFYPLDPLPPLPRVPRGPAPDGDARGRRTGGPWSPSSGRWWPPRTRSA